MAAQAAVYGATHTASPLTDILTQLVLASTQLLVVLGPGHFPTTATRWRQQSVTITRLLVMQAHRTLRLAPLKEPERSPHALRVRASESCLSASADHRSAIAEFRCEPASPGDQGLDGLPHGLVRVRGLQHLAQEPSGRVGSVEIPARKCRHEAEHQPQLLLVLRCRQPPM